VSRLLGRTWCTLALRDDRTALQPQVDGPSNQGRWVVSTAHRHQGEWAPRHGHPQRGMNIRTLRSQAGSFSRWMGPLTMEER